MGNKIKDLTGMNFGRLTVLRFVKQDKWRHAIWECQCSCENKTIINVASHNLIHNITKSCGCLAKEKARSFEDLTGKVYNKLTVIKRVEDKISKSGYNTICWLCKCSCDKGNEVVVRASDLKRGKVKSCGCIRKVNNYNLKGEYGIGYTHKGEEFYFDLEDYIKIKDYCWLTDSDGYIITRHNNKNILLHRLIMNVTDKNVVVDHIYHKVYDNRKSQLRLATSHENSLNNKCKGVYWDNTYNKWIAQLTYNKKKHSKGFHSYEEAREYRKYLEEKYFGEFAYKGCD